MPRRIVGVYERADGQWVGSIDLGWVNGKRKRRVVYGHSQREAEQKRATALREIEAGRLTTTTTTVEKWLRYWLDEIVASKVKPRTLLTYRSYVETHLIPAVGKKRLDRLEPQHVRELHKRVLTSTGPKGRRHSSTTALHAHRILSTALEAAVKERRLTVNVARIVDAPGRAVPEREGLTLIEAKRVLATANADDDAMTSRWWAALMTGARQGECLGLRWEHVDLDAAVIDLAWSLQRIPYSHGCGERKADRSSPCGRKNGDRCPSRHVVIPPGMEHRHLEANIYLVRPKTKGSRRVVPLLPAMVAALRLHRERDTGPNPHGLVWHRPDGRPLDGRLDYDAWTGLLKRAKVDHVTLHEARNTTATLLLEAGVDPHVIASMLGHSHIVTTRGYQKVSLELARRAIGDLGQQLGLPAA